MKFFLAFKDLKPTSDFYSDSAMVYLGTRTCNSFTLSCAIGFRNKKNIEPLALYTVETLKKATVLQNLGAHKSFARWRDFQRRKLYILDDSSSLQSMLP